MNDIVFVENSLSHTLGDAFYFGIDLGTTYTVVAVIDSADIDKPVSQLPVRLLSLEQFSPLPMDGSEKSEMMASILGVGNDRMCVGNKLYKLKGHQMFAKDVNLFYHWKLDLGISVKPLYKKAVRTDIDDAAKVAGKILNYARIQTIGKELEWENVVVTVPASFLPNQRADVLQAMRYAQVVEQKSALLDEPNAAILGYLNATSSDEKRNMLHEGAKHFLVIDFGGGTCDLSLLRLQLENGHLLKMDNLSISRYNDLGGQDIDMVIAEQVLLPLYSEQCSGDEDDAQTLETIVMPQLAVLAERLKIEVAQLIASKYLSVAKLPDDFSDDLTLTVSSYELYLPAQRSLKQIKFSAKQLHDIMLDLFRSENYKLKVVDKVIRSVPAVIDDTLKKAGLKRTEIDYILFVGGSVQNLLFVKECSLLLPQAQCLIPQRPDTLVAKGAALYSFYKHRFGIDLICPIVSDTIAVVTQNAEFYPLFKAGQTLPIQFELSSFAVQSFYQRRIDIPFCIDNADKIVQVISIALSNIPGMDDVISIKGELDKDKVLKVQVLINGEEKADVRIENPIALANLSDENRALVIAENNYEAARMKKNTGQERELLLKLIGEYYELGNYDRCITMALEFLKTFDPTHSTVLNYLFCSYNVLGQQRKAFETISKAVKYHPNNSTLQYNYSIALMIEKGRKAVVDYLESLPSELRAQADLRMRYAILQHKEDESSYARKVVDDHKAGRFHVSTPFLWDLLKQIYQLLGEEWVVSSMQERASKDKKAVFSKNNLLRVKASMPVKPDCTS